MKKDIHPAEYREVIFEDSTSGKRFLIGSTVETEKTDKWEDGKTYPVFQVEISSASHPFYTGTAKTIDTAGRVEKFKTRAAAKKPKTKK
jgi:large subunit ribosomal protein L31